MQSRFSQPSRLHQPSKTPYLPCKLPHYIPHCCVPTSSTMAGLTQLSCRKQRIQNPCFRNSSRNSKPKYPQRTQKREKPQETTPEGSTNHPIFQISYASSKSPLPPIYYSLREFSEACHSCFLQDVSPHTIGHHPVKIWLPPKIQPPLSTKSKISTSSLPSRHFYSLATFPHPQFFPR